MILLISEQLFSDLKNRGGLTLPQLAQHVPGRLFGAPGLLKCIHLLHLHFSLINGLRIKDDDPFNSRF